MKGLMIVGVIGVAVAVQAYQPAQVPLMTPWGEKITVENAWREYPRPNLVRAQWTNLNGLWQYAVTKKADECPTEWQGEILVPFALESALSGVGRLLEPTEQLWYRRTFSASMKAGERLILNFGGVDFRTQVFINGVEATDVPHESGNLPFSVDITDFVKEGENELILSVWDPSNTGFQSVGKQVLNPHGCMYTRMSGIWQTAWLETVPAAYVRGYTVVTDIDKGTVAVKVIPGGELMGAAADVAVMKDGKEISVGVVKAWGEAVTLPVPNAQLWSPETPNLYDLRITLRSPAGTDEVKGYFGMRKIERRRDEKGVWRFFLNNKKVFLQGTLDQGWWPDGLLTPPSDDAMAYDIKYLKEVGFNCMRKHIKIEPLRYYYLCDKLGIMLWQDMPSGGGDKENRYALYRDELKQMIDLLQTFPSIVMWVPYNEGWGQPGKSKTNQTQTWVKQYDPTRLVNGPSGWTDHGVGDTRDMHNYPGPGMFPLMEDRISVLGEFGGIGYIIADHAWSQKGWGYVSDTTVEASWGRYENLMKRLAKFARYGLGGSIYTQTTDVENERNGLLTYDRKVAKYDTQKLRAAHEQVYRAAEHTFVPEYHEILPTSQKEPHEWKYTTEKPADDWAQPAFDDSKWKSGPAGFGNENIKRDHKTSIVRTSWETNSIWLRRTFEFKGEIPVEVSWRIFYDEDPKIYLNGQLIDTFDGYNARYEDRDANMDAFRKAVKPGKNVLAVEVINKTGGAYIDLGINGVSEKK